MLINVFWAPYTSFGPWVIWQWDLPFLLLSQQAPCTSISLLSQLRYGFTITFSFSLLFKEELKISRKVYISLIFTSICVHILRIGLSRQDFFFLEGNLWRVWKLILFLHSLVLCVEWAQWESIYAFDYVCSFESH